MKLRVALTSLSSSPHSKVTMWTLRVAAGCGSKPCLRAWRSAPIGHSCHTHTNLLPGPFLHRSQPCLCPPSSVTWRSPPLAWGFGWRGVMVLCTLDCLVVVVRTECTMWSVERGAWSVERGAWSMELVL